MIRRIVQCSFYCLLTLIVMGGTILFVGWMEGLNL